MTRDRVLIDTSVWIAYFQPGASQKILERVDELVSGHEIFVPKVVLAELMQGAHSEKEIAVIEEFLQAFEIVGENEDTWVTAGKLSYSLRKKGHSVKLVDCYIAALALENKCAVFSLDAHFNAIQKQTALRLLPI